MRRLILIMTITAIVSSCSYDIDEILLQRDDVSFTLKGQPEFVYNPLTCQMSHNSKENIYRMHDDKLADWLVIKCSEKPDTQGQEITADISWTASSSTKAERGLKFTVEKTSSDGRIWMWNKSKRIGIVVKNL